jgi:hypothetical protein
LNATCGFRLVLASSYLLITLIKVFRNTGCYIHLQPLQHLELDIIVCSIDHPQHPGGLSFIVMEIIHPVLNFIFDMSVVYMINYFFGGRGQ